MADDGLYSLVIRQKCGGKMREHEEAGLYEVESEGEIARNAIGNRDIVDLVLTLFLTYKKSSTWIYRDNKVIQYKMGDVEEEVVKEREEWREEAKIGLVFEYSQFTSGDLRLLMPSVSPRHPWRCSNPRKRILQIQGRLASHCATDEQRRRR
ncbi:hypothetical protein PoB_006101900 [Plakobranchus ocellatus]|uniref:Uncharacterized protein n=1 Tax=Plakobranchus ocellatus TaxID=259542 RepID=A0AAV4CRN9_9GAST|nr:hypothetical protein PoB_006101900 [Plakobranchus ocellatus]